MSSKDGGVNIQPYIHDSIFIDLLIYLNRTFVDGNSVFPIDLVLIYFASLLFQVLFNVHDLLPIAGNNESKRLQDNNIESAEKSNKNRSSMGNQRNT